MRIPEEKWRWDVDLTDQTDQSISSVESEPFNEDDDEVNENQGKLLGQIANGWDWMREEERAGRVLGFIAAILFWGTIAIIYYLLNPIK